MINISNIIVNLIVFLPIIIIFSILPFITRKDIMFGVTIPSDEWQNDYFKKLRKSYALISVVMGTALLGASAMAAQTLSEERSVMFLQIALWSTLFLYFLLYIFFWIKTRKYKEAARWQMEARNIAVADTEVTKGKRLLSPLWYLIYVLIIGVTFAGALRLYDAAPDMMPVRFGMQGDPLVFSPKSMKLIYEIIGMQTFMALLFFGINFVIKYAKKIIDPDNPEMSSAQNDKMKYRWSVFLFVTGLVILVIFTIALLSMMTRLPAWVVTFVPIGAVELITVYAVVLAVSTGQSGNRIKMSNKKNEGTRVMRDDDAVWKLGMFYFNKDDPAVFVEKRFGAGWTNNWARWQSWLVLAAILGVIALSVIVRK